MNTKMALIAIFVSAVITFGLRALPFLVFQEGKELPDQIKRLGMVLPSSIMAVLIVYCLKDVGDDFMADGLWKLIAQQSLQSVTNGNINADQHFTWNSELYDVLTFFWIEQI